MLTFSQNGQQNRTLELNDGVMFIVPSRFNSVGVFFSSHQIFIIIFDVIVPRIDFGIGSGLCYETGTVFGLDEFHSFVADAETIERPEAEW